MRMIDITPPSDRKRQAIQPAQMVEPVAPATRKFNRKYTIAVIATSAVAIIVIGITSVTTMKQTPEASKNNKSYTPAQVSSVPKAHASHNWSWKRRFLQQEEPEVPGVPDPVGSIAELVTPTTVPVVVVPTPAVVANTTDLNDPVKKDVAMQLVSSAENSTLNWRSQYAYIQDIGDGRGYTGGIIGFTSGTHDMLELVQHYAQVAPGNILQKYLPALQQVDGTDSHAGLGTGFENDWKTAAQDAKFQQSQDYMRDTIYFNPAVQQAKADGLHALGQFIYYDAMVMHGPGDDPVSFGGIRATAMAKAKLPSQGGNETTYLNAFLDARKSAMQTEAAHDDTSRVDTAQRLFLNAGNLHLNLPLTWQTYGDSYTIKL